MRNKNYEIVPISETQVLSASDVFTEAFFEDPFYVYILPDAQERTKILPWYFAESIREGMLFNGVYTTEGEVGGAMVWLPPLAGARTPERARLSSMDQLPIRFGLGAYQRYIGLLDYLAGCEQQTLPLSRWYLSLIAVSPSAQGRGIGSALLNSLFRQIDREGSVCSLETFVARNLPFYQSHGFRVIVEDSEPQSHLPFWVMRRDPQ